jgi:dolichol-phosphate mannosyltransferase
MTAVGTTTSPGRMRRTWGALPSATGSPVGRLTLFSAIGLSGFAPNLVTLVVLGRLLGMHYVPATVIATQMAILWNFGLLEQIAYRRHRPGPWYRRAGTFAVINNVDLLLRIPLLAALVESAHMNYVLATVVTLVAMFMIRFVITDRLIYRLRHRRTATAVTAPLLASPRLAMDDA